MAEQRVCTATGTEKQTIQNCLIAMQENDCSETPEEYRRNCFDPKEAAHKTENTFGMNCAKGAKKAVENTVESLPHILPGLKTAAQDVAKWFVKVGKNVGRLATENKEYLAEVRAQARKECMKNKEFQKAYANYQKARINLSSVEATQPHLMAYNQKFDACVRDLEGNGRLAGIDVTPDILPDEEEVRSFLSCYKKDVQQSLICEVAAPMAAGGASALAIKAAAKWAVSKSTRFGAAQLAVSNAILGQKIDHTIKKYIDRVDKKDLTPAERESLHHQLDIATALKSPEMMAKFKDLGLSDDEVIMAVKGMLDSDMGKIASNRLLLTTNSRKSNQLLDVVSGRDEFTPAGKAFRELMGEMGFKDQGLFNKNLTNDDVREIMSQATHLPNYMHEVPGIINAIDDLNANKITRSEFKIRVETNLFHNGPQDGFWGFYTDTLVPGDLKQHAKAGQFFENTVYKGDVVDGVTKPKYPIATSKTGLIHATLDRLSQATDVGNTKIFLEMNGKKLSKNMKEKISSIPNPLDEKPPINGMNTLRDLLVGNGSMKSNPANSLAQLKTLESHVVSVPGLNLRERSAINSIVAASRDRTLAFQDFVKSNAEFIQGPDGNVNKILLKDHLGRDIGVIDAETTTDEALKKIHDLFEAEKKLNGDPMTDLMKPRVLSVSEQKQHGLSLSRTDAKSALAGASGAGVLYYYCMPPTSSAEKSGHNSLIKQPEDGVRH